MFISVVNGRLTLKLMSNRTKNIYLNCNVNKWKRIANHLLPGKLIQYLFRIYKATLLHANLHLVPVGRITWSFTAALFIVPAKLNL